MNKKIIFLIAGSKLSGVGQTLKALDPDSKGTDDLAGNLCSIGGQVLVAVASDNIKSVRKALELNVQISQAWLDENPAS
jgi:hypothetical protein